MPTKTSNSLTSVAEVGGSLKQVQQAFSAYQIARNQFVNALSGFLEKQDSSNVTLEALMKNDVMAVLCCPLAQDPVPGIQSLSLQCLSKLSAADPLLSQVVVSCGILDSVIISLSHENAPVQASANSVLAAVSGSTTDFARRVLTAGVLPHLMRQLQSGPALVKEAAVNTLNSLISSSPEHATLICDDALLTLLVALLKAQDSPHSLLKALVLCLSNVAAGGQQLSEALTRLKALEPLTQMVRGGNTPPDLKAAALNALAQMCRHHEELANAVATTGVLQSAVQLTTDKMTPAIRRNASALLLQMVQKTPDLAQVVTSSGAPSCLQRYLELESDNAQGTLAGVMIVGALSSFKASIAKAVVDAGAGQPVIACVRHADPEVAATAAWAIECMASHGEDTTGPLIAQGALGALLEAYAKAPDSQDGLKRKLKSAAKAVIRGASHSQALEGFVADTTPPNMLKHLLRRLDPLLAKAPKGRQQFVTTGALMRLLALEPSLPEKCQSLVAAISSLFPPEVVDYYRGV